MAAETDEALATGDGASTLIRSIDWAATPLGPMAAWSQTLQTMVKVLVRSRFPLSLWWGPELVQLYNDAYRPMLAGKHPRALAQRASDCFRETWDVVGPMIEAPYRGEPATTSEDLLLLLDRKGFLEETHFKVAFSPVPDNTVGATGVGGVLGICAETTEQVYAERQLRTLRALVARAADAKTAEEVCARATSTFAENSWDVPFALLYLFDEAGKTARLVSNVGFGSSPTSSAPPVVDLTQCDPSTAWPLGALRRGQTQVYEGIDARLGALPSGRWSVSPRTAVALSLESPGQRHPYGALICGASPHRVLDAGYRGFFELAAAQIVTGIRTVQAPERALSGQDVRIAQRNAHGLLKRVKTLPDSARLDAAGVHASFESLDLRVITSELAGAQQPEADIRILVVDDDTETREYIARTLRERWTVLAVADGEAALNAAREWRPDLVLTEMLTPGLSGFVLLSELRNDARTRGCSVMMLSARGEDSRLDALEAGASDYLAKPFIARELVARVSTQVQLARLRTAAEAERARLFSLLMQLPVAIAACEGPNHVVTLKNPLADLLTQGRLRLGDTLSEVCSEFPLEGLIEVLDRVYSSGEPFVWREQPLSSHRADGGCAERRYDIALQPLRDTHGTVTGIVATAHEVIAPLSNRRRKAARRRELAAAMARERAEQLGASMLEAQVPSADAPVSETWLDAPVTPGAGDRAEVRSSAAATAADGAVAAGSAGAIAPQGRERSGSCRRVLVVDDDPDAAALLREALVELGFSVAVAYDGPSALQVAQAFHPDTAFVDIGLPQMDGFELGRLLREAEDAPGALRLVAITGYGRESDRLRSQQAGFDLHLVKPVALDALSGVVVGSLQRRRASGADDSARVVNDHGG